MRLKSKVHIGMSTVDFEWEGSLNEIASIPTCAEKIKESVKILIEG